MRIMEHTLPSGKVIRLFDTVIEKKKRTWYRVTNIIETGVELKITEYGEEICKRQKAAKFVPFECLETNYTFVDFPPIKCYTDESLIEKTSKEEIEKNKRAAKEAYAAKKHSVERTRRKYR